MGDHCTNHLDSSLCFRVTSVSCLWRSIAVSSWDLHRSTAARSAPCCSSSCVTRRLVLLAVVSHWLLTSLRLSTTKRRSLWMVLVSLSVAEWLTLRSFIRSSSNPIRAIASALPLWWLTSGAFFTALAYWIVWKDRGLRRWANHDEACEVLRIATAVS